MVFAIAQLSCFALLIAGIFAKCMPEHGTRVDTIHELAKLNQPVDEILAGEDTPVWLARFHPPNSIVYERLRYEVTKKPSIVIQSLDYWNSIKSKEGFRVRRKPIFDPKNSVSLATTNLVKQMMSQTYMKQFERSRNTRNVSLDSLSLVKMESMVEDKVLHPSVLVVVDYHDVHPHADRKVHWLMKERIIYALAFWNTVSRSLRKIRNPRVSLRIAGIVLTTTRHASPYLKENLGRKTLVNALPKMLKYWKKVAKTNTDFQIGSYDIVAHMTDIKPRGKCKKCAAPHQQKPPVLCSASKGPLCKLPNKIAGLLIHDDFAFNGLYLAISRIPKIFGSSTRPSVYHRRRWTTEALDSISTALQNATCMSKPKELYPPGKPVAPILAGELLPGIKQCIASGYKPDAWTCWNATLTARRTNCRYMRCSNLHNVHDHCSEVGWTLDGTFCDEKNTMICLDGECVEKK